MVERVSVVLDKGMGLGADSYRYTDLQFRLEESINHEAAEVTQGVLRGCTPPVAIVGTK